MNPHDFETRLRSELSDSKVEPRVELRRRILAALDAAPDRPLHSAAPAEVETADLSPRRFPGWIAGLAAGLVAVVTLRSIAVEPARAVPIPEPTAGLSETLDGSAAELESGLLAQADLLAEDARRAASILLDRMPGAPWARKSDAR